MGCRFLAAHGAVWQLLLTQLLLHLQSFYHLHLYLVSLIYERSHSRHALQVS